MEPVDGPVETDVQKVRFLIGDTDSVLLTDDQIQFAIDYRQIETSDGEDVTNIPAAAADCAAAIAAKFATEFTFSEDGQRFDRAQKYAHYMQLEESLRARAGGVAAAPPTT